VRPEQRQRGWALAVVLAIVSIGASCAHGRTGTVDPSLRGSGAIQRQVEGGGAARSPRLDHLIPARDSQGSLPRRFEWTAVPGADSYSVGIWNEVDVMIWRADHIPTNSFDRPDSLSLEPGTYLWSISALRDGDEIAASGLAAFVVRSPNP
jgi:hypothetical protein